MLRRHHVLRRETLQHSGIRDEGLPPLAVEIDRLPKSCHTVHSLIPKPRNIAMFFSMTGKPPAASAGYSSSTSKTGTFERRVSFNNG